MEGPTHSALIITVPEADAVVGTHRDRFDRAAAWGVPAHVTVLFPFISPERLANEAVRRVAAAVATVPSFTATFGDTGWFGEDVLYLEPSPAEPFIALTDAIAACFPEHQPYKGAHDEVMPHLTIAHNAPLQALRGAENDVKPWLPVTTRVAAVEWWRGSDRSQSWEPFERLALG